MTFDYKHIAIILIVALILAAVLIYYMGSVNPIIAGLLILVVIVLILNVYLVKFKK